MKLAFKLALIALLGLTFYLGVLEGPFVAYIMSGSFTVAEPLVSGIALGFFVLFLMLTPKVFKL